MRTARASGSTTSTGLLRPDDRVLDRAPRLVDLPRVLHHRPTDRCSRRQRVRFVWVPLGITVLVALILVPADDAWPWTRLERVMVLAIVDYVLVTYHFAAQHYGLLSLYRLRAGQARIGRRGASTAPTPSSSAGCSSSSPRRSRAPSPSRTSGSIRGSTRPGWSSIRPTVRAVGLGLVGAGGARHGGARRPDGPAVASPGWPTSSAWASWWLRPCYVHPFLFLVLWTAQHWMTAMGLASLVARGIPIPVRRPGTASGTS